MNTTQIETQTTRALHTYRVTLWLNLRIVGEGYGAGAKDAEAMAWASYRAVWL